MALPSKLKDFNLFLNGNNFAGQISTVTLPELTRQTEDWRGGGMDGTIQIDHGMEAMTLEWSPGGLIPEAFENFGSPRINADLLRFEGFYESDDTGQTRHVTITARGRTATLGMGDAESGGDNTQSFTTNLSYYKLTIDNRDVVEIDVPGLIFRVNGNDRYAERRSALGL